MIPESAGGTMATPHTICMSSRRLGDWDTTRSPGHSQVEWDERGLSRDPRGQRKEGRIKKVLKRLKALIRRG